VRILTVPLLSTLPPGVPTADVAFDPTKSAALWSAIRNDQPIPGSQKKTSPSASPSPSVSSTPTSPPLSVAPADISISVLNGSGQAGAAAKTAADLTAEGFHAVVAGDASRTDYTKTVVEYGPTKVQSTQTVHAAIPGSKREATSTLGSTITVIVGSSYSGVVPVTIGSATASASPTPTPSISSRTAAQPGCLS
jgi:hypothetical protein